MVEALSGGSLNIGPYRLLARLGSGSFGTVYAARRDRAEELAAVKVAHSEFSDIADFPARFRNEIEAISLVESDFVPKLIDARADDTPAWMATELIPGLPLDKVIRWSGVLPEEAVWHLGAGIAEALTAIHAVGCVHRDLRPKNVLLVPDRPWVIDFNLARLVDLAHRGSSMKPRADYEYMPPEEARDGLQAAEEPADIFALGATLVFAATGHSPLEATTPADAMRARPNLDGLQRELRSLVESCLLSRPGERPRLSRLRAEFASRTGGTGHDGFAAVLPPDIMARLERYRGELADAIAAHGPARLGWGDASPAIPGAWPGGEVPRPSAGPRPTAVARQTRPDTVAVDTPAGSATAAPVRWASPPFGSWVSGPVAVHGGRLVAACLNGTVAVLRTADGKPPAAWRKPVDVGAALHAGALLLAQGDGHGSAYVGAADGRVHAIDLASRRDRVVLEAAAAIEGAPVVAGSRVCALSADGRVHSVDPRTGERKVLFQMDAAATGALSAASGTIFATDTDGWMHAIDANTGRLNWHLPTDGLVLSTPLPAGELVYVCGTDGVLRQFGIEDGGQHATDKVGAPVHVAPVRDGNRLYVGSSDGVVHAYDIGHRGPGGLEKTWNLPLGEEIAGLAASGGRVYVATGYRLVEVDSATVRKRELLRMDCLIGAPPVISGRHCYVVGLGGAVICLTLS